VPAAAEGGRLAQLSAKEIKTIRALLKTAGFPVSEIATRLGIPLSTFYLTIFKLAAL
jgi:hypothetical protein